MVSKGASFVDTKRASPARQHSAAVALPIWKFQMHISKASQTDGNRDVWPKLIVPCNVLSYCTSLPSPHMRNEYLKLVPRSIPLGLGL